MIMARVCVQVTAGRGEKTNEEKERRGERASELEAAKRGANIHRYPSLHPSINPQEVLTVVRASGARVGPTRGVVVVALAVSSGRHLLAVAGFEEGGRRRRAMYCTAAAFQGAGFDDKI